MKKFEDQDEAIETVMSKLEELPDEKLGLFFVTLFGADGLLEMAQDFIEGREYGLARMIFETEADVDRFIKEMLT